MLIIFPSSSQESRDLFDSASNKKCPMSDVLLLKSPISKCCRPDFKTNLTIFWVTGTSELANIEISREVYRIIYCYCIHFMESFTEYNLAYATFERDSAVLSIESVWVREEVVQCCKGFKCIHVYIRKIW